MKRSDKVIITIARTGGMDNKRKIQICRPNEIAEDVSAATMQERAWWLFMRGGLTARRRATRTSVDT